MSGTWIKLNDIRVRVDRFQPEFWEVARAISNLYDCQTIIGDTLEEREAEEIFNSF